MSFEPNSVPLSQIAKLRSGFPFKSADWQSSGVPVIKIANVKGGRISQDGCGFVTHAVASKVPEWMTKDGDVLIAMTGYVGEVAWVRPGERFLINQRVGRFEFLKDSTVVPGFLYYYLLQPEIRFALEDMARGSAQPNLSAGDAAKLPVPVLPLSHQRQIVSFGRALDDRIDNLRATNATLEAIAQAIFKSWFIDFDPVRAKMEGREPEGMDAETAALFPSEFEESELGLIPRGWKVSTVGDVATIVKGRSYKSSELADSTTALVTLKSFERGGGFRLDGFKGYTGTYKPEQVVNVGECIIAFTDVTQQAEVIGRGALVYPSPLHSLLVASLDVGIIRPLSSCVSTLFLHHLLQGDRYVSHISGFTSGTTVLHLAKLGVPSYRFATPNSELIASFTDLAKPLWNRRVSNESTRYHLADLRDQLLPRLISGKLRIDEAREAVVESA